MGISSLEQDTVSQRHLSHNDNKALNNLLLLFIWFHFLKKKKNEQNKLFLVQKEIIMTPDEMAKRYFAFIVIWK